MRLITPKLFILFVSYSEKSDSPIHNSNLSCRYKYLKTKKKLIPKQTLSKR